MNNTFNSHISTTYIDKQGIGKVLTTNYTLHTNTVTFDFWAYIFLWKKKYPDRSYQDCINLLLTVVILSHESEIKVLKKLLVNCSGPYPFMQDSLIRYHFSANSLNEPGFWQTNDFFKEGYGLCSLVQFTKGGDELFAVETVARMLDVKIHTDNISQPRGITGCYFIRDPYRYYGMNPSTIVDMILGYNKNVYSFNNENGINSFWLDEWFTGYGPIRLFRTLQQVGSTGECVWAYFAPPISDMLFNRHQIKEHNDFEVHIYDDIGRSSTCKKDKVVATFSGDLSIVEKIEWSRLEKRKVKYIFNKDCNESLEICHILLDKFSQMNTPLELFDTSNSNQ